MSGGLSLMALGGLALAALGVLVVVVVALSRKKGGA